MIAVSPKMRNRDAEDLHAEWAGQANRLGKMKPKHWRAAYRAALRREAEAARRLARNARRCA